MYDATGYTAATGWGQLEKEQGEGQHSEHRWLDLIELDPLIAAGGRGGVGLVYASYPSKFRVQQLQPECF